MELTKEFLTRFLDNFFWMNPDKIYRDTEGTDGACLFSDKQTIFDVIGLPNSSESETYLYEFEGHKYDVFWGGFKVSFVFKELDDVIKIPLSGDYEFWGDELVFSPYINAIEEENKFLTLDYCIPDDMKNYFLRNKFFCKWKDFPVYTQKKVIFLDDLCSDEKKYFEDNYSKEIREAIEKLKENFVEECGEGTDDFPCDAFFAEIIKRDPIKGEEACWNLMTCLDDFTGWNCGFLEDMTPVCFDYGGTNLYA